MEQAIVGVCCDRRQQRILKVTFPSWREYAKRHGLPLIVLERSHAGEDYYWNKHLLYRVPELRAASRLLFLDNDVFVNPAAGPLLQEWDSSLVGATTESTQAGWSQQFIARYYQDYAVERFEPAANLQIVNTGVLIIPREQADFLEDVYARWRARKFDLTNCPAAARDRFAAAADQPHVSHALQAERRYRDFGPRNNTLWWHWYRREISSRQLPFLLRSKAAALTIDRLPRKTWRALFRRQRATFARALAACDFLHVAGSKSSLFLGEGWCP